MRNKTDTILRKCENEKWFIRLKWDYIIVFIHLWIVLSNLKCTIQISNCTTLAQLLVLQVIVFLCLSIPVTVFPFFSVADTLLCNNNRYRLQIITSMMLKS